jgi:protein-S-isoprenylcysteine O-methyltransferase Ste14
MFTLRILISIILLPFVVVVLVPCWLINTFPSGYSNSAVRWTLSAAGAALFAIGFTLFVWCVSLFARIGHGTLAPWDPTRKLVAAGPYRHVRNPMISGVGLMLFAESVIFGSAAILICAVCFVIINHIYFVFFEERGLENRFGEDYSRYKRNVPRWIPRIEPWSESLSEKQQ